jgi:toxin FitB
VIVLDTNVLSEAIGPAPAKAVLSWLAAQPAMQIFTTAIAEAEIPYGIALLPKARRRSSLEQAARRMFAEDFAERVLPFDGAAAEHFAAIAAARRREGRPIATFDAQIAAIARACGAALATRNVADFAACGIAIVDPWSA